MEKQTGLTRINLLAVIILILFVLFIGNVLLNGLRRKSSLIVCGTNLKGIGTGMFVYVDEFDGRYPQLPGNGPWAKKLGFRYDLVNPDFTGTHSNTPRTITASWYLLIRLNDISPMSFTCPGTFSTNKALFDTDTTEDFDGSSPNYLDIVQMWDFGENPYQHVSYAMHNPYGKYPANKDRSSSFALAADMNPWFRQGDIVKPGEKKHAPQIITFNKDSWKLGNTTNHIPERKNSSEGQNVLFADGHVFYKEQPNVGVNNDNIYTFWSTDKNPTAQDIQGGTAPTSRSPENDAKSKEDSFLGI